MANTVLQSVIAHIRNTPEADCLLWQDQVWTYGDLGGQMLGSADKLRKHGVKAGDRVALLLKNSPQYVALYLGAWAVGAVVVPLNAHERAGVLLRQILHADCRIVAGDAGHPEWEELSTLLESSGVTLLPVQVRSGLDDLERPNANDSASLEAYLTNVGPESLAMLIYTSGTTGRPKAVMLSHRNVGANASAIVRYLGLRNSDRGACALPFHFSYGCSVLNSHLIAGASLLVEENFVFPQATMRRVSAGGCTGLAGVPATFTMLLNRLNFADYDLSSLRYITQAGGAMTKSATQSIREALPNVDLYVMYGQTEATARITYLPPRMLESKLGSVGIPIEETEISIRAQDGTVASPGSFGEVCVRGPGVMMGYWRDAEATQMTLRDGWLHTGDLGHVDRDGFIYIDGREVEMIKVGAFRVSPMEIEEVIASLHEVQEVAVVGQPDEVLGQAIKAVIVLREGERIEERSVKAYCRRHLAAYKIPKSVEFATALPRTSSGKVQRFKLI